MSRPASAHVRAESAGTLRERRLPPRPGKRPSCDVRPDRSHQRHKIREAGRNHAGAVDGHRMAGGKPHDKEAHGDAVIVVRADLGSATRWPFEPFNDKAVTLFARVDATAAQPDNDCGEAVALLNAQLGQAM